MKRFLTLTGSFLISAVATVAAAQAPATPAAKEHVKDRAEILANDAAFVEAFNKADAKGLVATFTEDAEIIDEDHVTTEGRKAIQEHFTAYFAANPGAKITLETETLRFLGGETAQARGRSKVVHPDGEAEASRYTVIFVNRKGQWLQASSHDELDETVRSEERLKAVEWLVGDWVSESADSMASWKCDWSDNKSFLLLSFTVHLAGKPAMSGSQRIGWDPLKRQLRSWVFDSEGGYGEGLWSNDGDRWVIKASGVRHDGRPASATQILAKVNKDMIRWTTVDRTIAGKLAPEIDEFTMVRKPPAPTSRDKK